MRWRSSLKISDDALLVERPGTRIADVVAGTPLVFLTV